MAGYSDDYITVGERLLKARKDILNVNSEAPVMLNEVLGYIRVTVELKDGRHATGIGSFRLDVTPEQAKTNPLRGAQKTNPLEDGETSALGRALKFLGYDDSKRIASAEEVASAEARMKEPSSGHRSKTQRRVVELIHQCKDEGLVIEHPSANVPLDSLPYDDLLDFGKYLKSLLGG